MKLHMEKRAIVLPALETSNMGSGDSKTTRFSLHPLLQILKLDCFLWPCRQRRRVLIKAIMLLPGIVVVHYHIVVFVFE